jgi:hypothetical protein
MKSSRQQQRSRRCGLISNQSWSLSSLRFSPEQSHTSSDPEIVADHGAPLPSVQLRIRQTHLLSNGAEMVSEGAAAREPRRGAMANLTDNQRAVLQTLAMSTRGYALSTMMARGFKFEMLQDLVGAGLAIAQRDAVGLSKTKVPHLRITAAGRKAIAE